MHPTLRYEELRPDELHHVVQTHPIVYFPLGLVEHHGWHLPVGFDGIKAQRICQRCLAETGGVLFPVMWWGAEGGHGGFKWTHYQSAQAAGELVATTVEQLIRFGFLAIVLVAGHYPWQQIMDRELPRVAAANPQCLLLWGTEVSITSPKPRINGDHAALEETSFGLALLPELVNISALTEGRGQESWPEGKRPDGIPDVVNTDPRAACFSQAGIDARLASAEHGEEVIAQVTRRIVDAVNQYFAPNPKLP
jgi:creatinine amidohydrolase